MTTKLELYNLALGTYIGTQSIVALTDDRDARYALDRVYDRAILYMLEQGAWGFASRTVAIEAEATLPDFHRANAFAKPTDFVRIIRIAYDPRFELPAESYRQDHEFFYDDNTTLYLEYVSSDAAYGLDLTRYPPAYEQAVASWLAYLSALPVSKDKGDRADLLRLHGVTLDKARSNDAVDEPVKRKPMGRWSKSRFSRSPGGDRY